MLVMKKEAYHRLCLVSGELIEGPVVIELDDDKVMRGWHVLVGEEPMVEWIGGTYTCSSL